MAIVDWPSSMPKPERFIPGRLVDQIVHQGFSTKRAPVLTRSVLLRQTLTWSHLDHDDRQILEGLDARGQGEAVVIRVPWGFYQKKSGGGTGTPSVNGAHAAGATSILTQNWSGTSPYLRSWDMVGFETTVGGQSVTRVHRLSKQVASGDLTMTIWPALRETLASGAPIYFMPTTVLGGDGRAQPAATTQYLETCMALVSPSDLEMEAYPSNVEGHYSEPTSVKFVEVIQDSY